MKFTDKTTPDSRPVQSFAIIKSTGHGNFVIGRFQARARNGLSVWDLSVYSHALPTDTPSPIFSEGRGWLYTGYLERIIPSSNCPSKLTDKVTRIVHSKLKLFHFQVKKYYLSDANHQTDNPSHTNNPSLMNVAPRPWVGRLRVRFCFFTKIIFKLTIDISMCKIILEVKYFIKSMIYQMLKFFKFFPKMIWGPLFWFKDTKN